MAGFAAIHRATRAFAAGDDAAHPVAAAWKNERRLAAAGLVAVVLLAIGLRLIPIVFVPSVNWGDEIFQTLEPAHRLVFGYGLVPWEFQLDMRSWLLPGIVAGLMQLARAIGAGPDYYLPVIATGFAMLGCAPAICCFLWCRRWFGLPGALVAAAAVAVAPELVYFGARALVEVVAAHLLVIGCYLLEPGYPVASRRRLVMAGVLLGLVCLLRIHLAPAVAIIVIWSVWDAWRARFPAILAGGLAALIVGAGFDWLSLGAPLASVWRNVLFNIVYGVSAEFGVEPWNYYLLGELGIWAGAALLLVVSVALGARRLPVLLLAALTIVAVHSGIAHKEYRFIYPAIVLLMVLAGAGLGQLTSWGQQWLAGRGLQPRAAAAVGALVVLTYWSGIAFAVWAGPGVTQLRQRAHDNLTAATFVAHLPGPCGIGLYGEEGRDWVWYGGYAYLHRPLPMYWPADVSELTSSAAAFDTLLYSKPPPAELGFEPVACFGRVCVARRAGSCEARPMAAMPFPDAVAGLAPAKEKFEAVPAHAARPVQP